MANASAVVETAALGAGLKHERWHHDGPPAPVYSTPGLVLLLTQDMVKGLP